MKLFPSDFNYNIKLIMLFSLIETSIRGIWGDNILSLFTYLITKNSNFLVGLLTGIVGVTQVIFTLFTAIAADKYSRVLLLKIGGIISLIGIITSIISTLMGHYIFLLLSMIVWGIYWAFTSPALDALLADSVGMGDRSRVYSWSYIMRSVGSCVGPFVSIIMFATLGNNWKISECQIVMLIGLILSLIPTILLFLFQDQNSNQNNIIQSEEEIDVEKSNSNHTSDLDSNQSSHGMLSNYSSHGGEVDLNGDMDDSQHQIMEISLHDNDKIDQSDNVNNNNNNNNNNNSGSSNNESKLLNQKYFLCFPDIPHTPAMIASADVISGLASGMTIKFFPIYFVDNMHMTPIDMSLLFMVTPLLISGTAFITQKLSKLFGRLQIAAIFKLIGISCFVWFLISRYYNMPVWVSILLYMTRTATMNSSKPLTTSAIMDTVPASQRIRWNSLEAINQASWAGSAVFGGYIIDKYGMSFNFILTIIMQLLGIIPLIMVAKDVPIEGNKIISVKELLHQVLDYLFNKSENKKETKTYLEWFESVLEFEWISNSEKSSEYSQVSDMEMSVHGSYKNDYGKNNTQKQNDEEEDETIVLN